MFIAILRLAITNVFIVTFCALRNKMLEACDSMESVFFYFLTPEGSHVYCHFAPCDNKCFHCTILSLAEQMFSLYHLCLAIINVHYTIVRLAA